MRTLTKYAQNSEKIQQLLNSLADKDTSPEDYRISFYNLGANIAELIKIDFSLSGKKIMVACSSEDADWLSKGIIDNLPNSKVSLAVFWNVRNNPFNSDLAIAPIIKTYIEDLSSVDYLIVCKSIIYTSCVVRTNLTYLIEKINPGQILIAAPVIYKDSENGLKTEFDTDIADKFSFFYFAKDTVVNNGEVVPGIGGSVYERLGLEDSNNKNKYIPFIVQERRVLLAKQH